MGGVDGGFVPRFNEETIIPTDKGFALYEIIAPQSAQRYESITKKFGYGKLELLYELLDELILKLDKES